MYYFASSFGTFWLLLMWLNLLMLMTIMVVVKVG